MTAGGNYSPYGPETPPWHVVIKIYSAANAMFTLEKSLFTNNGRYEAEQLL